MAFKRLKQASRAKRLRRAGISIDEPVVSVAYGARSGIWSVCPDKLSPNSVVYSVGVGNNIAWDLAMITHHGVELHAFDPTPRAIEWVQLQSLPLLFHFHPVGLSGFDGAKEFLVPRREHQFNYSSVGSELSPGVKVSCGVKRLSSLQAELGHETIDILKMDIEGEEMQALPDVLASGVLPGQLLVEFHYNYPEIPFEDFRDLIEQLRAAGYRIFYISERGYEFSFVHQRLLDGY
ncbi:MAG: FkbM family methyltransferase [Proteobacteria bacterium]|nr:FkbM family methyltransferase [Pseudomonadota bacterium]